MPLDNSKIDGTKYKWGDVVRITDIAPLQFHPGELGSICGIRRQSSTQLYLIEFSDGSSTEIPEHLLDEYQEAE